MYSQSTKRSVQTESLLASNQVLRNTYFLLGLTIVFSALMATLAVITHAAPMGFLSLIGMFGLLYLVHATAHSGWGVASTFLFTGFMGYTLGPMIGYYMTALSNGPEIVASALGATGLIFLSLSTYVLATKKDFSFMGGFLFVGVMVAFLGGLAAMIFNMPLLHILVSGAFAVLSSALIMFHTSNIIHGGERNYILATISIYVALYNLFVSLLHILSVFADSRD